MNALATSLGHVIRQHRSATNLSQEALAERSGLHRNYVGLVERGERNVTIEALDRIASALGTRGSRLLNEAEALVSDES